MTASTERTYPARLRDDLRLITAILLKDLVDALRNRNTLAVLISVAFLVGFYRLLPPLTQSSDAQLLRIYDAGDSLLVPMLENLANQPDSGLEVRTYPSQEAMFESLLHDDIPMISLSIPADLDLRLAQGEDVELQAYYPYWATQKQAAEAARLTEALINQQIGILVSGTVAVPGVVRLRLEGGAIPAQPRPDGPGVTAVLSLIIVQAMIGMALIPNLMLEEKQTRTLEALLVSPARSWHITLAKALVGMFYGLLGTAVVLLLFHRLVEHWWLALLAAVLGLLFTIGLGLALGTLLETRQQLILITQFIFLPLLVPVILVLIEELVPSSVMRVARWVPTSALLELYGASFSSGAQPANWLTPLVLVLASALLVLGIQAWLLRRLEASPGGLSLGLGLTSRKRAVATPQTGRMRLAQPATVTHPMAMAPSAAALSQSAAAAGSPTAARREGRAAPGSLRITAAIAGKDVVDALSNRLTLTIILAVVFIMFTSMLLPRLLGLYDRPTLVVYDPGDLALVHTLGLRQEFHLIQVDSLEELKDTVAGSPGVAVGVVIPPSFRQSAGSGEVVEMEGYLAHWAEAGRAAQRVAFFEEQLSKATWQTVRIEAQGNVAYPSADSINQTFMVSLLACVMLLTMGMGLTPHLLVEEKEAHTLEVILVSPAGFGQVIAGKALVGGFYCLCASALLVAFNLAWIVHWGMLALALLAGAAFAVAVGLLVGALAENASAINLWMGAILLVCLVLVFLEVVDPEKLPAAWNQVFPWLPPVTLARLVRFSMAGEFPAATFWAYLGALLVISLGLYAVLPWVLRKRVE